MENKTVLEKDITSCRRSKQRSDLSLHMPSPGTHPQCPAQGGRCSHSLHSLPLPPASYEAIMPDHRWCGMCVSFTNFFCLVHHVFLKDFTHLNKYHFSTLWLDFWFYYRFFFKLRLNSYLLVTCQTIFSIHSSSLLIFLKHFVEVLFPATVFSLLLPSWQRCYPRAMETLDTQVESNQYVCPAFSWQGAQASVCHSFCNIMVPSLTTCPQSAGDLWTGLPNTYILILQHSEFYQSPQM